MATSGTEIIKSWPQASREAARLVIDAYGEPQEATESQLVWRGAGPWERVVASRELYEHRFPAPHHDSVEPAIDHRVPPEAPTALARFDSSVVVQRTVGEVSAPGHDDPPNLLAVSPGFTVTSGSVTESS